MTARWTCLLSRIRNTGRPTSKIRVFGEGEEVITRDSFLLDVEMQFAAGAYRRDHG
jgi:hypothetical protein